MPLNNKFCLKNTGLRYSNKLMTTKSLTRNLLKSESNDPNLPIILREMKEIWCFSLTVNDIVHTCLECGGSHWSWFSVRVVVCFAVKVPLTITRSHARGMDAFKLTKELRLNYEQEVHYLPKKTGLSLIASSVQVSCFSWSKQR